MATDNKHPDDRQDLRSIIPGGTPLQPKKIPPVRAAALRLKELGYDPIPLWNGKDNPFKGWPRMPNEPANIARWNGHSAAIRLKGSDLFVIDLDLHIAAVRDAIVAGLTARWPAFMAGCLRRHSEAVSLALIGRAATVKRYLATRRFTGEGTGPRGDMVEYFTGNAVKYVGVWGVRGEGRSYGFHGRSILEVRADELPWFPDEDIYKACDLCEAIMRGHGLEPVMQARNAPGSSHDAFDLEPEMIFECSCGDQVTLEDLAEHVGADAYLAGRGHKGGTPGRGYATLWDQHSTTPDRVSVLTATSTGLCLHDFKTGITHRWKRCAPPEDLTRLMAELKALHAKWQAGERS